MTSVPTNEDEDICLSPPDTSSLDPYVELQLERTASDDEIKRAYRKAALKHHPDKVATDRKAEAHTKFQRIALSYAILSSSSRRARYDATGLTTTTSSFFDDDDDADFNWTEFFRAQYATIISASSIVEFRQQYKASSEERVDLLEAYLTHKGDMEGIFEDVMLSDPLEDEERFRKMIDEAIANGEVVGYEAYVGESATKRKRRATRAKREAKEAREMARELGVEKELFGRRLIDEGARDEMGKEKGTEKRKRKRKVRDDEDEDEDENGGWEDENEEDEEEDEEDDRKNEKRGGKGKGKGNGNGNGKAKGKKNDDENEHKNENGEMALAALIRKRHQARSEAFLEKLEAKYTKPATTAKRTAKKSAKSAKSAKTVKTVKTKDADAEANAGVEVEDGDGDGDGSSSYSTKKEKKTKEKGKKENKKRGSKI